MSFDEKLNHLVDEALREDVGDGDHSALSCIPATAKGKAVLKIKQEGCWPEWKLRGKFLNTKTPHRYLRPLSMTGML